MDKDKYFMYLKKYWIDSIAYGLCFLFAVVGSIVSLNRFWQYEVFYYDFGIFDRAIWLVAHFQAPIIDHLVVSGKWIFADHFSPSIFLLSPLYWITSRGEILLVAQAAIVALSGCFLYLIGTNVLKKNYLSFGILLLYFLFVGLQNAIISDFHEVTIATLPLMLVFYAIVTKRTKLFFLSLLILLGCKESMMLVGIGLAFFIAIYNRLWFKQAFLAFVISLAWGIVSIKVIIPFFSGGIYQYGMGFPKDIPVFIASFYNVPTKVDTLYYSFASFGFLPLFAPSTYFLIFQDLLTRFVPYWPTRWGLGLHYSALLGVVFAVGSVFGLKYLLHFQKLQKWVIVLFLLIVLHAGFLFYRVLHGPFMLASNKAFYAHTQDFKFLNEVVVRIPKDASVMTHNNLAPHFTHQTVWVLNAAYARHKPDYIILDVRPGQNPNNFFASNEPAENFVTMIKNDPAYRRVYHVNDQYIFQKK